MLKKIKGLINRCNNACRTVALITGGEMFAFFHTSVHGDFVTAYLVASTWIKDRLIRYHERKQHRDAAIARKSINIA